jgi:hypothetical protein
MSLRVAAPLDGRQERRANAFRVGSQALGIAFLGPAPKQSVLQELSAAIRCRRGGEALRNRWLIVLACDGGAWLKYMGMVLT